MKIIHSNAALEGQPPENTFLLVDEITSDLYFSAILHVVENPELFPNRPLQLRMQCSGSEVPDAILGAIIARAREISENAGLGARLYTYCAPDDATLEERLYAFGFEDNDGLIRLKRPLEEPVKAQVPVGCRIVEDRLEEPLERRYFLDRHNSLFKEDHDADWLSDFIDHDDFRRIILVSSSGLVGEILLWTEGDEGIIGYLQTAKRWRRLGVGTCLTHLALSAFREMGVTTAEASFRRRYPHVRNLFKRCGFTDAVTLMKYPGIDIDPLS